MKILKIFSVLLSYPSPELQEAMPEVQQLIAEDQTLNEAQKESLQPLLTALATEDIYDLQENYVFLFDRSRSLSLNLFEHIHGESRDRGTAMVDLLHTYKDAGFELSTAELPDHLPVLLEFLSLQSASEARATLNDAGAILVALADRLKRRKTHYAAVLDILAQFAGVDRDNVEAQHLLAEKMDNPADLQALDAVWEETPVTFGQPDLNDPCSGMLTRNMPTGDLQHAERMVRAQLQAIPEHDAMGRPVDSPAMPQGPYGPLAQAAGQEFPIFIQRSKKAHSEKRG